MFRFRSFFRSKTLLWIIIGTLLIPFILFFSQSNTSQVGGSAGSVFGKSIDRETFDSHLRWVKLWSQSDLTAQLPPEFVEPLNRQETWQRLILLEEAKRRRVRVSDQELASFIRSMDLFAEAGQFSPARYHRTVSALGMTPRTFETLLNETLMIDKLVAEERDKVVPSEEQLREAYRTSKEQASITYVKVEPEAHRKAAESSVTDEDVRAYYESHVADFRTPEQVTFDYIGLSRDDLIASIEVSDEAVAVEAEATGEMTDSVRPKLIDRQANEKLVGLAVELENDQKAGATIDQLAERHELQRRSIGPVPADGMTSEPVDPALIREAARLDDGQTSGLLESASGVYVVRLTARHPAASKPLEEVSGMIRGKLVESKARELARAATTELAAQLGQQTAEGKSFENAAQSADASLHNPPAFTRTDPIEGIDSPQPLVELVFSVAPGSLTGVIELPSAFVIAFVKERVKPESAGTEEIPEAFRSETLEKMREEHLRSWANELHGRAQLKTSES